jgi:hypothetical protein
MISLTQKTRSSAMASPMTELLPSPDIVVTNWAWPVCPKRRDVTRPAVHAGELQIVTRLPEALRYREEPTTGTEGNREHFGSLKGSDRRDGAGADIDSVRRAPEVVCRIQDWSGVTAL